MAGYQSKYSNTAGYTCSIRVVKMGRPTRPSGPRCENQVRLSPPEFFLGYTFPSLAYRVRPNWPTLFFYQNYIKFKKYIFIILPQHVNGLLKQAKLTQFFLELNFERVQPGTSAIGPDQFQQLQLLLQLETNAWFLWVNCCQNFLWDMTNSYTCKEIGKLYMLALFALTCVWLQSYHPMTSTKNDSLFSFLFIFSILQKYSFQKLVVIVEIFEVMQQRKAPELEVTK